LALEAVVSGEALALSRWPGERKDLANKLDLETLDSVTAKVITNIGRIDEMAKVLSAKLTALDVDAVMTKDEIMQLAATKF
jgi:hypothetical protein